MEDLTTDKLSQLLERTIATTKEVEGIVIAAPDGSLLEFAAMSSVVSLKSLATTIVGMVV